MKKTKKEMMEEIRRIKKPKKKITGIGDAISLTDKYLDIKLVAMVPFGTVGFNPQVGDKFIINEINSEERQYENFIRKTIIMRCYK